MKNERERTSLHLVQLLEIYFFSTLSLLFSRFEFYQYIIFYYVMISLRNFFDFKYSTLIYMIFLFFTCFYANHQSICRLTTLTHILIKDWLETDAMSANYLSKKEKNSQTFLTALSCLENFLSCSFLLRFRIINELA